MPRSIFLGRPVPGPGEPLWLPDDRAWAIALRRVEADECPGCGNLLSETLRDDNDRDYTVTVHGVCTACYVKEAAVKDMPAHTYATAHRKHDH